MQKMTPKCETRIPFLKTFMQKLHFLAQSDLTCSHFLDFVFKMALLFRIGWAAIENPWIFLNIPLSSMFWERRRWVRQIEKFDLQMSKTVGYLAYLFFCTSAAHNSWQHQIIHASDNTRCTYYTLVIHVRLRKRHPKNFEEEWLLITRNWF